MKFQPFWISFSYGIIDDNNKIKVFSINLLSSIFDSFIVSIGCKYTINNQDELLTPSLDLGILSGVMRENIINVAKKIGISCKEMHVKLDDVNSMDEAFISATGIGLLECYWNDWTSNYSITKQIKKELFKSINNN